jgi:hypothetical protein
MLCGDDNTSPNILNLSDKKSNINNNPKNQYNESWY